MTKTPQDMRAGIQRLASVVTTDFSMDPTDGALYCFVSRDCLKMKLLRFETNGWCMYYVRLAEGGLPLGALRRRRGVAPDRAQAADMAARRDRLRAARGAQAGRREGRPLT